MPVSIGLTCQRIILVIIVPILLVRVGVVRRQIEANKLTIDTFLTYETSCADPLTVMTKEGLLISIDQPLELLQKANYMAWGAFAILALEVLVPILLLVTCRSREGLGGNPIKKVCALGFDGLTEQLADAKHVIRLYFVLN